MNNTWKKTNEDVITENDLKQALANQEFSLVYQPQMNLVSGEMIGAEALIRWKREGKVISPVTFIPVAEESGLIVPIGNWVLRTACSQLQRWNTCLDEHFTVSVNISPVQFHSSDFVEMVKKVVDGIGILPQNLELEITENMAMDVEKTFSTLKGIKEFGVRVSIDDFGKGYSSLSYLKQFPIDKLKIDKSFVQDIDYDINSSDIVEMMIMMAHKLNLKVIAEGIETKEQYFFLKEQLCDEGQGYYLYKPLQAKEVEKHYEKNYHRILQEKNVFDKKGHFFTEKQLRINKESLTNLIRLQAGIIFKIKKINNQFVYTMADGKLLDQLGLREEIIIGKTPEELFPPDISIIKNVHYARAWKGEVVNYEVYLLDMFLYIMLQPVTRGGEVVEVIGSCLDVTDRKTIEFELGNTKGMLETIWENVADPIFLIGVKGGIIEANRAFESLFGWKVEEIKGQWPVPIIPQTKGRIIFNRLQDGEILRNQKVERITKDGRRLDILASYVPVHTGEILAVGIYKDITQEVLIQKKMKESEEQYRTLVENNPEAIVIHVDGNIVYCNKAGLHLVGANKVSEVLGRSVLDFVHPDSKEHLVKRLKDIKRNRSNLDLMKEKFQTLDGQTIITEVTAHPITYKGEHAVQAIIRDITEKEKAVEALTESEERYRLIAENTKDLIKTIDVIGVIQYASLSHKTVLHHSLTHYLQKSIFEFIHPDDLQLFHDKINEALITKQSSTAEVRHEYKKGEWIWTEVIINPVVRKGDLSINEMVVVARDISDRMKNQELKRYAYYDPLTGLLNRRKFERDTRKAIKQAEKNNEELVLVYFDVDNFKEFNDQYGHKVGDEVLRQFALRVRSAISKNASHCRMGGDEFVVLIHKERLEAPLINLIDDMVTLLREPYFIQHLQLQVTTSMGIAMYPFDGRELNELLIHADVALYQAKEKKNKYQFYYSRR